MQAQFVSYAVSNASRHLYVYDKFEILWMRLRDTRRDGLQRVAGGLCGL